MVESFEGLDECSVTTDPLRRYIKGLEGHFLLLMISMTEGGGVIRIGRSRKVRNYWNGI